MIQAVYYTTPGGVQTTLSARGAGRRILASQGLGPVDVRYLEDVGPYQHGTTVRDWRLPSRIIDLDLFWKAPNHHREITEYRTLVNTLRPNRADEPGYLLFHLVDGSAREIAARILQGPRLTWSPAERHLIDADFRTPLRFLCASPLFRDPDGPQVVTLTASPLDHLIFYESPSYTDRAIFPILFGIGFVDDSVTVTNNGTFFSLPSIVITGPIKGPRIINETLDLTIQLNYSVNGGESVTIELNHDGAGVKRVTSSTGENLIGTIDSLADLADWRLEVAPVVTDGDNVITLQGTAGSPATVATITYYENYLSI